MERSWWRICRMRGRDAAGEPGRRLPHGAFFQYLVKACLSAQRASMITLVMALAVAEAVEAALAGSGVSGAEKATGADTAAVEKKRAEQSAGVAVRIKWPNDIVVNRKKVCGMLTEMTMTPDMNEIQYLVVGVGINVNNESPQEFQEEIRDKATSLRIEKGCRLNRAELLRDVLCRFETHYQTFLETLTMSKLREAYQARLQGLDGEVRVLDPAGEYTGISRGINDRGELLVERENGGRVAVYAGEVSVRGLYGYV